MQLQSLLAKAIIVATLAYPVACSSSQHTTMMTVTKREDPSYTTTVTIDDTAVQTGAAAPQIGGMPQYCVNDGEHLHALPKNERVDCEYRIERLSREDAVTWVDAVMPRDCKMDRDEGMMAIDVERHRQDKAGQNWHSSDKRNKACDHLARKFKKKDVRKTWIAGMLPLKCRYRRDKPYPHDVEHEHLSHREQNWCEDTYVYLEKAAGDN